MMVNFKKSLLLLGFLGLVSCQGIMPRACQVEETPQSIRMQKIKRERKDSPKKPLKKFNKGMERRIQEAETSGKELNPDKGKQDK